MRVIERTVIRSGAHFKRIPDLAKKAIPLVGLIFLFGWNSVSAQSPLALAPWEVSLRVSVPDISDTSLLMVQAQRIVPLSTLLPQVTADSRIELLRLGVGARNYSSGSVEFRYRLTALDLILQRSLWGAEVVILDYDKSSVTDLDGTWLSVATGPGLHFQGPDHSFSLRVMAEGGISTWRFGDRLFNNAEHSDRRFTGAEYGFKMLTAARMGKRLSLMAGYDFSWLTGSTDLSNNTLFYEIRAELASWISVSLEAKSTRPNLGTEELAYQEFGFSIRLQPNTPKY